MDEKIINFKREIAENLLPKEQRIIEKGLSWYRQQSKEKKILIFNILFAAVIGTLSSTSALGQTAEDTWKKEMEAQISALQRDSAGEPVQMGTTVQTGRTGETGTRVTTGSSENQENWVIDANGNYIFPDLSLTENSMLNHIFHGYPEFAKHVSEFNLKRGRQMLEVYNASRRGVHDGIQYIMRTETSYWKPLAERKASTILATDPLTQDSEVNKRLINLFTKLQKASGLKPDAGLAGRWGGENAEQYMTHALEKIAAEKGRAGVDMFLASVK